MMDNHRFQTWGNRSQLNFLWRHWLGILRGAVLYILMTSHPQCPNSVIFRRCGRKWAGGNSIIILTISQQSLRGKQRWIVLREREEAMSRKNFQFNSKQIRLFFLTKPQRMTVESKGFVTQWKERLSYEAAAIKPLWNRMTIVSIL